MQLIGQRFQKTRIIIGHHDTETDKFSIQALEGGTVPYHEPVFDAALKDIGRSQSSFYNMQQNEIAFLIAEDLFKTRNLAKLTQVFEESEIRKVYLQELMRTLKISERKAKTIYGKKQVEEQKGTG